MNKLPKDIAPLPYNDSEELTKMRDDIPQNKTNPVVNPGPIGDSMRNGPKEVMTITAKHHSYYGAEALGFNNKTDNSFIKNSGRHFTRDINDTDSMITEAPVTYTDEDGNEVPVFSGSTTNVNPLGDKDKEKVIVYGLDTTESDYVKAESDNKKQQTPISPLHPFTRMDPSTAQISNLTTYNRTKLPVADLEFRKGFRHIFFTRPECYIMARNPNGIGAVLSEQAENDEDFASCYSRMPHILSLLSPIYITGSFSQNKLDINSNWNYLLSNRVQGLTTAQTTMSINENISKSIEGYTVTPASLIESRQGSTIDFKFRDTKNMEVYEMLRMWMLYMHKRKKGIFAPPYNGYQYRNGFMKVPESGLPVTNDPTYAIILHPYDRALEYCASVYDIITNESMTKILYWCKYYGIYPTAISQDGLSNDNNEAITNMTLSATFKYHYRLECVNKTLAEFNYNAGITDNMGRVTKRVQSSLPFLLRDDPDNKILKQYIGGGGMFTSSPYIVLGKSQNNPLNGSEGILTPYLRFMPINDDLDGEINLGLSNTQRETDGVIGVKRDPSSVTYESVNTHSNVIVNEDGLNPNIHGGSTGTF